MPAENENSQNIATAVAEVSERATLLVREEIELAKAEVVTKVTSLAKGAVVGIAAGIFAVFGLIFVLEAIAWALWRFVFHGNDEWVGFIVVGGGLFLFGGIAGYLAFRAIRAGAPPVPQMAIDEAKKIRDTVSAPKPERGA